MWIRPTLLLQGVVLLLLGIALLGSSTPHPRDEVDQVRAFTRNIEFEYLSWILNASRLKIQQQAVGFPGYVDRESRRIVVSDYLHMTQKIIRAEEALDRIYADATITDKAAASEQINTELQILLEQQDRLAPLAEGILEAQVAEVAAASGLTTLGQAIPGVLFHTTSVPDALIVSPRGHIEQTANISISPGLPIAKHTGLEEQVERNLDVSSLVVPIGGVGVYPTMIMRTTDLVWLTSTIAHEWTHNYLLLRPLGILYDHSPELRTMNETTADIVGNEIGSGVIQRHYPDLRNAFRIRSSISTVQGRFSEPDDAEVPVFDFRAEMHTTRVNVDAMLASGKITDAELYMERRRRIFVQNGYFIRRLNQAYFAFHGAYADIPGGAAGEDPVGPAVRALRARSLSLADFVNRISWMTSFEQLKQSVDQ